MSGYADAISVAPGGAIAFHLAGSDRQARVDIFRLGLKDARLMRTVLDVPVAPMVVPPPDPATGLDEMRWPAAYRLRVPTDWTSGVYLAKLTAAHGQSYVLFVVRPTKPTRLVVVIPMLTFEAYNSWNGVSLYDWRGHVREGPSRGYKVSLDRPFATSDGAGLLFRDVFPLIVWLEDHGYQPGYVADGDLATQPSFATQARTLIIAGHSEYWTQPMRQALVAAEGRRVGVVDFSANSVWRQIRLEPSRAGAPQRTVVCYKDPALDPVSRAVPELTTVAFSKLPSPEPESALLGGRYIGMVARLGPMTVAPGMNDFSPSIGLAAGRALPGLLAGETDGLDGNPSGLALMDTPNTNLEGVAIHSTASLWISPTGAHVFDAGTFAWAWGLDPRYGAALPGFPTSAFARLTAEILAWAGTPPA